MQVHIVGGFLGSGKTTGISMACKALAARKLTAGVITNDQGKKLVDTAYFDGQKIPAVQVTNGCFACNYDDLIEKLNQLTKAVQPDVVFAEAVGCSADIVAAVVKPLQETRKSEHTSITYTVFADTRLFSQWISGDTLPFSQKVLYLYDRQLEEAGLIVLNKRDLVSPGLARQVLDDARNRFPGKHIRLQNSLDPLQVDAWLDELDGMSKRSTPLESLRIDYDHYAEGRCSLGWVDTRLEILSPSIGNQRALVIDWITGLEREFHQRGIGLGHLKVLASAGKTEAKFGLTFGDAAGWRAQVPDLRCRDLHLLVNARAEADPVLIHEMILQKALSAAEKTQSQVEEKDAEVFRSEYPKPKRRVV